MLTYRDDYQFLLHAYLRDPECATAGVRRLDADAGFTSHLPDGLGRFREEVLHPISAASGAIGPLEGWPSRDVSGLTEAWGMRVSLDGERRRMTLRDRSEH